MIRWTARLLIVVSVGAVLGAVSVAGIYVRRPALTLEMDRDLPRRLASGLYPVERAGETTFAWTSRRVEIRLAGLNRASTWECSVRLRGGRSDPATQPIVDAAIDGITVASTAATNEFRDIQFTAPSRRSGTGLSITLTSSATIVPGPSDSRELGFQIDRIVCEPVAAVLPPRAVLADAALIAATFGAAIVLIGASLPVATVATGAIALAQSLPFSAGAAPYIGFSGRMLWCGVWIAALAFALTTGAQRWRGRLLGGPARFAILFSAAALYLKLLGLLHPSKLPVDAVFHAHRLEWVLAGRYFFTQPMPGGVSFPYAIGLYVFAAPWSALTADHVMLLRIVVCAAEVVAGLLLYPLIVRAWGDRAAAAAAVVLFNVVPLPYGLVGNANLTNAFGQSVALATLIVASLLPAGPVRVLPVLGLFLLCALSFLSHVSTFAILAVTLLALSLVYMWRGDKSLRRTAWVILAVTISAALLAVIVYYGHFGEVYRMALRVRAEARLSRPIGAAGPPLMPLGTRVTNALTFTAAGVGWPILVLAVAGLWRVWAGGFRDRAVFLVLAWAVAYASFLGVAVMRVDAPFQRYAAEFFGRVLLATYPGVVVLAAGGVGWAWRAAMGARLAGAVLILCAVTLGVQLWIGWFH